MRTRVFRIISLLLTLFLIISQRVISAEYIVSGVSGDVSILREGESKRQVNLNDVILSGDMLRTKRDSFLSLKAEQLYYRVYPYSTVKIGTEPILVWGKLASSKDKRFLDIHFFFFPKPSQGRTMEVVVRSSDKEITINSTIEDEHDYSMELMFYPIKENEYRAITGFDVETSPVRYSLQISAQKGDDLTKVLYPFYLRTVQYGTGRVDMAASKGNLFTPSERKQDEWEVLREVLSTTNSEALWNGVFDYPVDESVIISKFGKKRVYFIGESRGLTRYHRGIDFRGNKGDAVLAPNSGTVVFTGERVTTGNTLVIDHGQGVYSLFFHLDSILVAEGTPVQKGSKVAEIGETGITAGPHLHWSVYVNGVWVNPMDWLQIKF